jgi:hypothetical protein
MLRIPENATIWAIGTGDGTRDYFNIFKKYNVVLVGPGNPGKNGSTEASIYFEKNPDIYDWGSKLEEVQENDVIIARKGLTKVLAVGFVHGDYNHSNFFDDVEGWDLQHYRQVNWALPVNGPYEITDCAFTQGTLKRCLQGKIVEQITTKDYELLKDYTKIPYESEIKYITISSIIDSLIELIDSGIRIEDAENIGKTIQRIIRLTEWYYKNDFDVLEHEIIAFLVLPLLIAIGWSEQKTKIEYAKSDIALFSEAFKGDYTLHPQIIIEVKSFHDGLAFTHHQMKTYSDKFPDCKKFIATNGFRYRYFEKENDEFVPKGFFNLLKLKERDYLNNLPLSAIETILAISNFN